MTLQIQQWWISLRIDNVCWIDISIVWLIIGELAFLAGRKALELWRWRGIKDSVYVLTDEGQDML